ncbi:ribokinase [Streptosporangium becharense]|uniref:Ribokinase n=1 Tax=Streptosporangium becharense TaxID=1816182 RepID=A0A7W9IB08_9ACTN|nr:ribokinase [Streptosporangium becharense]MBB2910732.1 ribokinase [Streptosporangium becharense]MBB5817427.1 ribokinase [Streptosporangium becharense]
MRIAVVGSYGVGMTMSASRIPEAGETVLGGVFSLGPGGKGSNQAIAAARLGGHVDLLTIVGPDAFGDQARQLWAAENVGHAHVRTGTGATMIGFIMVEPGGENRILVAPGALDELGESDVERFAGEIAAADLLVVSLEIPLATALAALRAGREAGTTTLLNPAPAVPLPREAFGWIDYLTPNMSEARILADAPGETDPDRLADALRAGGFGGALVMTLGGDGALVDEAGIRARVAPVRAPEVVDTTGAGDAFTAALAVRIAEGASLAEAVGFAAAAGAHAVGRAEVIPALPHRSDVDALLAGA